jgi:hypothetical protein
MDKQDIKVDAPAFKTLLQRVCLGGLVEECVLEVSKGVGKIRAIDMSQSMFLSVTMKVGDIPDGALGLGSLSTIIRFLEGDGEYTLGIKGDRLTFKRKGHGSIGMALLKPSEIPTAVPQEDAEKKLVSGSKIVLPFTEEHRDRFGFYMGIIASQSVVVSGTDGRVTVKSGEFEQNKFTIPLGKYEGEDFSTILYGSFMLKVLMSLPWGKDEQPVVLVGDKHPLIVRLGKDNLWAITPVASGVGE